MTVCTSFFESNPAFWISLILSVTAIIFLTLYLPFRRIKSRWKYLFIPLFALLLFIAIVVNMATLGMGSSCDGLWDRALVTDYNRNISSLEEAKDIFRIIATLEALRFNGTAVQRDMEASLNSVWEDERMYHLDFFDSSRNCYELHKDGKLYQFWCGE